MTQLNNNEWWFSSLFRLAGYGLLALSLFNIVDIFIPPRFTDPVWEFQMGRNLVESAPVSLLGLVLVLSAEKSFRFFKFLSGACLVVGVLFLLLLPLGVSCTWRLDQQNKLKLTQQAAQLQQLKDQVSKATTAQEIGNILTRLSPQSRPPEINNPQQLKSKLLSEIAQAEKKVNAQAEANIANTRLLLVKNALKWNLGALVCGVVFLSIWRSTSRVLKANRGRV